MGERKRGGLPVAAGLLGGILLICLVWMGDWTVRAAGRSGSLTAELYYFSPCESCREDAKFEEAFRRKLKEAGVAGEIVCLSYNAFREQDRLHMESRMEEMGLTLELEQLPAALIGDELYFGDYEEIGQRVARQSDSWNRWNEGVTGNRFFVLFTTYACESCEEVKDFWKSVQVDTLGIELVEYSIMEEENLELLQGLMRQYGVLEEEQQVPILFHAEGYLSGKKAIIEWTGTEDEAFEGDTWDQLAKEVRRENTKTRGGWRAAAQLFFTGLVNGLNPCAASMLLMVLSILLMRERGFVIGSMLYMAGKLAAYLGMGLGAFQIFRIVHGIYLLRVEKILTIMFAVLALVLCILNVHDYVRARRKEYGRVAVQLPRGLRKWNHSLIDRMKMVPTVWMFPALFILGLVISAGEFFCTGQLYVASVYTLLEKEEAGLFPIVMQLLVYVLAMCIPQTVLILIIGRTRNLLEASRFTLERMPAVKLAYAVVFFILFLLLLFT